MISVHFQGKPFSNTVIQIYAPTSNAEEAEAEQVYEDLQNLLERTPKKHVLFTIEDGNAKVGSQEIAGVTGKTKQSKAKANQVFQENALVIANINFQQTREDSTHGHHQMVNTEIRLIIVFPAKDGEALYTHQKQDRELTMAQIMNSLLPNSD